MPGKPAPGDPNVNRLMEASGIQGRGDTFFPGLKLPMFEGWFSVLGIIYICMFQVEKVRFSPSKDKFSVNNKKVVLKKNTNKIRKNSLKQTKPIRTCQVFQLLLFFYTHISSVHQKKSAEQRKTPPKKTILEDTPFFPPKTNGPLKLKIRLFLNNQ